MTTRQILLMNFGFFGIQYSFGLQRDAISPIYTFLHASPDALPILSLAGPLTGLLIQPLIGALSDRTWSPRWGRRKPFFLLGAIGCSVGLFLFPFVTALWMAVLLLWLLDASNNTAMEPYKAFIADKLSSVQLGKGFLTQSLFTGLGAALATGSFYFFRAVIDGGTKAGIPYWVFGSFMLGAVCSIASVLVSILSTPENPPTPQELTELHARRAGLGAVFAEIAQAIKDMPETLWKLALVYLFQWYGLMAFWQYACLSAAKSAFGTTPADSAAYAEVVSWNGLVSACYNLVAFGSALFLAVLAKRYDAKWVHLVCLLLAGAGVIAFPHMENKYLLFLPMIGFGIGWASVMGVPFILAVTAIPKKRYGVYMGVLNVMICIPQLLETFTFGPIYRNLLHDDPGKAVTVAGTLLLIAAAAMLWIRPTRREQQIATPAPTLPAPATVTVTS
jgi:maltose/moltooligosaccharide transporter